MSASKSNKNAAHVRRNRSGISKAKTAPDGYTWIYFLEAPEIGHIKIGRAQNLMARHGSIQSGSPVKIIILVAFLAKDFVENALHAEFKAHQVMGEWFRPADDLLKFIDNVKAGLLPNNLGGIYKDIDDGSVVIYHPSQATD